MVHPILSQTSSTDRLRGYGSGVAVKAPVRVVTTVNIDLEGEQTVNGIAVVEGDRVLVKDQSDATENGIYTVSSSDWERSPDFDGVTDVVQGTLVVSNNDTSIYYRMTTASPIAFGTSEIEFEVVSGAITQASVGAVLYPLSAKEADNTLIEADIDDHLEYGRMDRYTTPVKAVLACDGFDYELHIPSATFPVTASLVVSAGMIARGAGCDTGVAAGSILETSGDIIAIDIADGVQRTKWADFGILVGAATTKPVFRTKGAYTQLDNLVINCDDLGFGGVLFGDADADTNAELLSAGANAWQGTANNLRVDDFTYFGIGVNSRGHTFDFANCSPRTSYEQTRTINAATSANPIEFTTSTDHGYQDGRIIQLDDLPGDFGTNLNGRHVKITVTDTDKFTVNKDGGAYAAYTSGGSAKGGAHALLCLSGQNVHVYGGQFGAGGAGGVCCLFFNSLDSTRRGGSLNDMRFEGVGVGEIAVVIDGDGGNPYRDMELNRLSANLTNGVEGTMVRFGKAIRCSLFMPGVETPTGGGTLCWWDAESVDCVLTCAEEAASAPVNVHASATRPVKVVVGEIPLASVSVITVAANLRTILRDGVTELPAGPRVHNGVGWDYFTATMNDDTATSVTLPVPAGASIKRVRVKVYLNGSVTAAGTVMADVDSGGAALISLGIGADLELKPTGALAVAGDGNDTKLTLSAHTDGKLYALNRLGAQIKVTFIFEVVGNL